MEAAAQSVSVRPWFDKTSSSYSACRLLLGVNADLLTGFVLTLEAYDTVYQSKQGIIATLADIIAGVYFCTALSDKNAPCRNELSVCPLNA